MSVQRPSYPIELFTHSRHFVGTFEPLGALLDDINDPNRGDFYLTHVTFTPLDPTSPLKPVNVPEAVVRKHDVIFLFFRDKSAHEKFRLFTRTEQIIVYTTLFAAKGNFHLGAEQRVRDMFDTMRGHYQAMTEVTVFPLVKTQVALPREIDLILINNQNILFYHPAVQE